jgi:glycine cleavage system H protein
MSIPAGLKFTKTDEWVSVNQNIATIGITDYAQNQLSDVVFVEVIFSIGQTVKKGTTCASVESVKAAADVTLPVSGKVTEINTSLPDSPELVNSDPFGAAWMLKVELSSPAELNDLMDEAAYQKYCQEREH